MQLFTQAHTFTVKTVTRETIAMMRNAKHLEAKIILLGNQL
jgi:hypothetical protein